MEETQIKRLAGEDKRIPLPQEAAYAVAIVVMTLGVAMMQKADFGLSMVVAPAYMLSEFFGISFGMAEYSLQFVLVGVMCLLIRRFHFSYYLSFATAVIYGFVLDGFIALLQAQTPAETLWARVLLMLAGMVFSSFGVALFFRTYLPACAYDMFVKVVSERFSISIAKFKIGYDLTSLVVSILFTFLFFGKLKGIGVGTLICALVNGMIINGFSNLFARRFRFPVWFSRAEDFLK